MKLMIRKNKLVLISIVIMLITAVLLQFVQLKNKNLYLGHDWIFHYNRFYDAAQQIKDGNFQYFISMYGFSQSGRIVNGLYGPLFAYFNGLLIVLSNSWLKYQLISNFLITFLSGISIFFLLRKNKVRISFSLLLSILYTTLYAVQGWVFNQAFTSWGAVIMPLGVAAAVQFFDENYNRRNMYFLVFAVTLSIQIHVLTTFILVMILTCFFLVAMCVVKNKQNLLILVISGAVITIFTTANVWYPLLETNFTNSLLTPFLNLDMDSTALKIILFSVPTHISLITITIFIFQFILGLFSQNNLLIRLTTILSFIFFLTSTRIFPWNELISIFPSIALIQLPSRFLLPAIVLGIFSIGITMEKLILDSMNIKKVPSILLAITFFLTVSGIFIHFKGAENELSYWTSDEVLPRDANTIIKPVDSQALRSSFNKENSMVEPLNLIMKPTSDYVPIKDKKLASNKNFHPYNEYKESIFNNPLNSSLEKKVINKTLILSWRMEKQQEVTLPIFVYDRTELQLNGEKLTRDDFAVNNIGALKIQVPKGKNSLTVKYHASLLFYFMLIVTVVSWGAYIGLILFDKGCKE